MKKLGRSIERPVATAIHNRIKRSKLFGTFLGVIAFGGGVLLTANAANPNQFFNPRGLFLVLGSAALAVVESDFTKKSCAKVVANTVQQYTSDDVLENITDKEYFPAKYASSLVTGLGANIITNALLGSGSVSGQTVGAGLLAGSAMVGLGVAGFVERERHLRACETQFNDQLG